VLEFDRPLKVQAQTVQAVDPRAPCRVRRRGVRCSGHATLLSRSGRPRSRSESRIGQWLGMTQRLGPQG
jgi:hypothetical protein